MNAVTTVSVADYLSTVYEPECDYVDGELEDRNGAEKNHSKIQRKLIRCLPDSLAVFPEVRIQIGPTRYRVPDICVYRTEPPEQVFVTPPLLIIEILSPEDRWSRVIRKLEDFSEMGCPNIWVFDPWRAKAYRYDAPILSEIQGDSIGTVDCGIEIRLSDIW